jgi:hypothetical protein
MKNIKKDEIEKFDCEIQNSFSEIFIEIFSDINKYNYKVGDEIIFRKNTFLSEKSVFVKKFYEEFIETQMFFQFEKYILNMDLDYFRIKKSKRISVNKDNSPKIYIIKHHFEYLIKKNVITNNNYVINYLKNIENEKYDNSKCIIYQSPIIPTIEKIVKEVKESNNKHQKSNNEVTNAIRLEEEQKYLVQIYKNEVRIRDYLLNIFKNDIDIENDRDNFNTVLHIIKNDERGRDYFIKLISKNPSNVVILPKNSFKILHHLFHETLLFYIKKEESSEDFYKDAIVLIKSTMNYGISEKTKKITIFDLCTKIIHENILVFQEKFWEEWFIIDANKYLNLYGIILNDDKYEIMMNIIETMKKLKIGKSIINLYTSNIMEKYFVNDLNVIQKINNYISKI